MGFGEQGKRILLTIWMYGNAGNHLRETRLSEDQVVTDIAPGVLEIRATVQSTHRLQWWLLGFGEDVEVIEPVDLREAMQAQLRAAMKRYAQ